MTISGSKVSRIPQAKARPRLKKCTDFSTIPSWKAVKMNFCNLKVFPTTLSFRIMDVSNGCIWKVTTIRRNHILNWTMILGRVHSPKQTAKRPLKRGKVERNFIDSNSFEGRAVGYPFLFVVPNQAPQSEKGEIKQNLSYICIVG